VPFTSVIFVTFFLAVYAAYLLTRGHRRTQNALLVAAGYTFYGYWDVRFLSILLLSTAVAFIAARCIQNEEALRRRRLLLVAAVSAQLTVLAVFKYFNFFSDTFAGVLRMLGFEADLVTLKMIVPLGISFYTFQAISYTVDVYRRRIAAATSLLDFTAFTSFFPQLVAGPIGRATNMLPQFSSPRKITADQLNCGLFLLIWGYFQKMVVADRMAAIADPVFNQYHSYQGADFLVAILAYSFQVYGDFAGYSNIARGLAKFMGFELAVNFNLPYFSRSPSEFWTRWHISLSNWLRDYLFLPLSYSLSRRMDGTRWLGLPDDLWVYAGATMFTMLLAGLWHGATWTFVLWGGYQGLLLAGSRTIVVSRRRRRRPGGPGRRGPAAARAVLSMALMFGCTAVGWVLFRCSSLEQTAYILLNTGFDPSPRTIPQICEVLFFVVPFLALEAWQYRADDPLVLVRRPLSVRLPVYATLVFCLGVFGVRDSLQFIYFRF